MAVLHGEDGKPVRGERRPQGPARTGHRRRAGAAPPASRAGGQRGGQPEAARAAAQPGHGGAGEGQPLHPPGPADGPGGISAGDSDKAREYNQTAEAFANRLIATENQVNDLKTLSLQSAQAADQARAAVQQNSLALQQKLAERQKLLSQLDQAKMQEQLNRAMSSLNQTVDREAPSLEQVRAKIEARYAKAIGTSELGGQTVEMRMLEVEQASMGSEAKSRLDWMRAELGLPGGSVGQLGGGAEAALGTGSGGAAGTGLGATGVQERPGGVPAPDGGTPADGNDRTAG